MESQIEVLYVIIALLAGGLGIVVTFLIKFRKKQEDSIQRREHEDYVQRMEHEDYVQRIEHENDIQRMEHEKDIQRMEHEDYVQRMEQRIVKEREDATNRSRNGLKGRISEQMSPLFPEFYSKYEPSDARFMGSPIDFLIFKNMSKFDKKTKDEENPIEIVLVDVKTGKSAGLSQLQKSIKNAVEENRVSFDVIKPNIEQKLCTV